MTVSAQCSVLSTNLLLTIFFSLHPILPPSLADNAIMYSSISHCTPGLANTNNDYDRNFATELLNSDRERTSSWNYRKRVVCKAPKTPILFISLNAYRSPPIRASIQLIYTPQVLSLFLACLYLLYASSSAQFSWLFARSEKLVFYFTSGVPLPLPISVLNSDAAVMYETGFCLLLFTSPSSSA